MKFSIVQATELRCIFVRSAGKLHPPHMRLMIESISKLDFYQDRVPILHDMRQVEFDVPMNVVRQVAGTQPTQPKHTQLALVADSELGYGMLRALAMFRENEQRVARAFHSIDEAMEWLELPEAGTAIPARIEELLSEGLGESDDFERFGLVSRRAVQGC